MGFGPSFLSIIPDKGGDLRETDGTLLTSQVLVLSLLMEHIAHNRQRLKKYLKKYKNKAEIIHYTMHKM